MSKLQSAVSPYDKKTIEFQFIKIFYRLFGLIPNGDTAFFVKLAVLEGMPFIGITEDGTA